MEFITLVDIKDEVLHVTDDDISAANEYVMGLAQRFRVKPADLLTPPTYTVKRIAICYACYVRAISEVGTDAMANYDGNTGDVKADNQRAGELVDDARQQITNAAADAAGATQRIERSQNIVKQNAATIAECRELIADGQKRFGRAKQIFADIERSNQKPAAESTVKPN